MNTQKKILLITVIVLAAAVIGWIVYDSRRKKAATPAASNGAGDTAVDPNPLSTLSALAGKMFSNCPSDSFPLKKGSCGKRVEQMQVWLLKKKGASFSTWGIDGKWGDETDAIVKKFILKNEPYSISEDYFTKTGMAAMQTSHYK